MVRENPVIVEPNFLKVDEDNEKKRNKMVLEEK